MKRTSILFTFSLLWITHLLPAQIGARVQQGNLTGTWLNTDLGYTLTLLIQPNGTGELDGDPFTYTSDEKQLILTLDGKTTAYTYQLSGNTMTLSGGDIISPVQFKRSGADANEPAAAVSSSSGSGGLVGVWSGNGEQIEFTAEGVCIYLGQQYPYSIAQGQVSLMTSEGQVQFAYSISGDQLTLSANGQTISYTRGSSPSPSTTSPSSGQGQIAKELVGEWCWIDVNSYNQGSSYSSRCIILNADGTYSYSAEGSRSVNTPDFYGGTNTQSSDRGTWYVQGDRIYYNSPTNGQGSYRLEKRNHPKNVNDPMIVLDGEAYVTTTQRPPWR